jgi:subtilisin family serine protease
MVLTLTRDLKRIYRRNIVTPVIIKTRTGFFESIKDELKEIVPTSLLEARFPALPRITKMVEFPMFKWKEIPRFNMLATILTPDILEEIARMKNIEKIYPDYLKYALKVPPEGIFLDYRKRPFTTTYWVKKVIGADRANQEGYTGKGVKVCVIDSGSRPTHPQLRKVVVETAAPEKGMSGVDQNGHGCWCTSAVGGTHAIDPRYRVPVEGMAPECDLISIQALGFIVGMGSSSDLIKAMDMAITLNADIVSMSLGSSEAPIDAENPEAEAINKLVEHGIIPVIAAGNEGPDEGTINSPGSCLNSLTVGAWDSINDKLCDFSSRGPTKDGYIKPDIVAPGFRINSALVGFLDAMTDPEQPKFGPISGTSMATPCAAGLIACARQMYAERGVKLTVQMIKELMEKYGGAKNNETGWGILTWDILKKE